MYYGLLTGWPFDARRSAGLDTSCPHGHEHPGPWRSACAFCEAIFAREQADINARAAEDLGARTNGAVVGDRGVDRI